MHLTILDLSRYTIEELEAFVEIAAAGSLLAAATHLDRPVGDIQAAIGSMENKIGNRLFQRAGSLRMTRAAKNLHPFAVAHVQAVRDLRRRLDQTVGFEIRR